MTDKPIITEHHYKDVPDGKQIAITALWTQFPPHCYIITAINNTTYYKPGDRLTEQVMQQICNIPGWQVCIVSDDLIGKLLGLTGSALGVAGQVASGSVALGVASKI